MALSGSDAPAWAQPAAASAAVAVAPAAPAPVAAPAVAAAATPAAPPAEAPAQAAPDTGKTGTLGHVNTTSPAYIVEGVRYARILVDKINFIDWVEALDASGDAMARMKNPPKSNARFFQREKMLRQLRLVDDAGNVHPMTLPVLMRMPAQHAISVDRVLGLSTSNMGTVSDTGDGVLTPITVTLGEPIKSAGGDVTELEILAPTMTELEDVIAESGAGAQTVALLRIARPLVPGNPGLVRMPDNWLSAIALGDGLAIMRKALPRFFE